MASINDLFGGRGAFRDVLGGSLLGSTLFGPLGQVIGGAAGGQRTFDVLRRKHGLASLADPVSDPATPRGGAFAGASAGAGAGSSFGPIGAIVGGVVGGVAGGVQGRKLQRQRQEFEANEARIFFEAERSERQLQESLLEQTRTRARFSNLQSGSLLTG